MADPAHIADHVAAQNPGGWAYSRAGSRFVSGGPGAVIALTATTLPCAVQPMMRLGVGVVGLSSGRDRQALLMAQHDQLSPVANWRGFVWADACNQLPAAPVNAAGLSEPLGSDWSA
jgi:hypothetical protein